MSSKSYAAAAITAATAAAVMTSDPPEDRKDRWNTLSWLYRRAYDENRNLWTDSCRHGKKCSRLAGIRGYLEGEGEGSINPALCVFYHSELGDLFLNPNGSFRKDPPVDYCPVISDPDETEAKLTKAKDDLAETEAKLTKAKSELTKAKSELTKAKSETEAKLTKAKSELAETKSKLAETEARNQFYTAVWHQLVGAMQVLKTMLEHSGSECSGVCDEVLVIMGAVPYAPSTV